MNSTSNNILKEQLEEITNNKNPLIPFEIKKKGNEEYFIIISLEPTIIANSPFDIKQNLEFLIYIQKNYPINPPRLYCLTDFPNLNISELRDLLEDVIKQPFHKEITLLTIINLLPQFLSDYFLSLQNNPTLQIGKFYLDDIYNIEIIKKIKKKYFKEVSQELAMYGKTIYEELRFLLITNNFFFLFINMGLGIINIGNMKLAYWAHINSLDTIRHTKGSNTSEYIWKLKKKRFFTIILKTYPVFEKETDKIVDLLIENLKNCGIVYSITNKNLGPKTGQLPPIEINIVEDEINKLEIKIKNPETLNQENLKILMNLYEKAVQYYSAINDNRFEGYMKKIQGLMSDQKYLSLLEGDLEEKKIENGINQNNKIIINDNNIEGKKEELKEEKIKEEKKEEKLNIPSKGFIESIKEKISENKEEEKKEESKVEEEKKEISKVEVEKKEESKVEEEKKEISKVQAEKKEESKVEEEKKEISKVEAEKKEESKNEEVKKEESKVEEEKKEEPKNEEVKDEEKKEEEKKIEGIKESIVNSINKEELNLDLESSEEEDEEEKEKEK
jgi:ubiquitin-protein ligase